MSLCVVGLITVGKSACISASCKQQVMHDICFVVQILRECLHSLRQRAEGRHYRGVRRSVGSCGRAHRQSGQLTNGPRGCYLSCWFLQAQRRRSQPRIGREQRVEQKVQRAEQKQRARGDVRAALQKEALQQTVKHVGAATSGGNDHGGTSLADCPWTVGGSYARSWRRCSGTHGGERPSWSWRTGGRRGPSEQHAEKVAGVAQVNSMLRTGPPRPPPPR
eukprot:3490222-Amphidinium_carterae.1